METNPQAFAVKMAERWQNSLKRVVTPELQEVWMQQAETLNAKIRGEYPGQWLVLHPPTGSGKSRGLESYCSMLPHDNHPGVLIVVRMTKDASKMADTINRLTKPEVIAIACHSDNDVTGDMLSSYPVAIITHEAYKMAMEDADLWHSYTSWDGDKRKLVVIDETLNIIHQTQIDYDQIKELQGVIPDWLRKQHPDEYEALDHIITAMSAIVSKQKSKGRWIYPKDWKVPDSLNIPLLRKAMQLLPLDEKILEKTDEDERKRLVKKYCKILTSLETMLYQPCWYAQKGTLRLFTCASVIVPRNKMDAVIMDATASCNPVYDLLGDRVVLIEPPEDVRSYENVTLHVSIGHKLGKLSMSKNQQEHEGFIAAIAPNLPTDRQVFICTHKDVKKHLLGYDEMMPQYEVAHWGAIDGKNDWNECGTAIMYGLQYLDGIVPETNVRAIEKWQGHKFSHKERADIVHSLDVGHQIVTLVQAMNRVRCRNVIDLDGNCEDTDIFLLLPDKTRAIEIIEGIAPQMPGMQYKRWKASALKRKAKRSKYEPALLACLEGKSRGTHRAQDIRKELNIPKTCFDRLIDKMLDTGSELYQQLDDMAVWFRQQGDGKGGRGNYSVFEKAS